MQSVASSRAVTWQAHRVTTIRRPQPLRARCPAALVRRVRPERAVGVHVCGLCVVPQRSFMTRGRLRQPCRSGCNSTALRLKIRVAGRRRAWRCMCREPLGTHRQKGLGDGLVTATRPTCSVICEIGHCAGPAPGVAFASQCAGIRRWSCIAAPSRCAPSAGKLWHRLDADQAPHPRTEGPRARPRLIGTITSANRAPRPGPLAEADLRPSRCGRAAVQHHDCRPS